jgi:hypothetical protein
MLLLKHTLQRLYVLRCEDIVPVSDFLYLHGYLICHITRVHVECRHCATAGSQ